LGKKRVSRTTYREEAIYIAKQNKSKTFSHARRDEAVRQANVFMGTNTSQWVSNMKASPAVPNPWGGYTCTVTWTFDQGAKDAAEAKNANRKKGEPKPKKKWLW
jgi:hypothetical protein